MVILRRGNRLPGLYGRARAVGKAEKLSGFVTLTIALVGGIAAIAVVLYLALTSGALV